MPRRRWDKHDIVAEVHRRGETLASLSRKAGLYPTALSCMLSGRRWPRAERALADFLGVPVERLFPDRYGATPGADSSGKSPVRKVKNHEDELTERRAAA